MNINKIHLLSNISNCDERKMVKIIYLINSESWHKVLLYTGVIHIAVMRWTVTFSFFKTSSWLQTRPLWTAQYPPLQPMISCSQIGPVYSGVQTHLEEIKLWIISNKFVQLHNTWGCSRSLNCQSREPGFKRTGAQEDRVREGRCSRGLGSRGPGLKRTWVK